jgi:hypothetical protein
MFKGHYDPKLIDSSLRVGQDTKSIVLNFMNLGELLQNSSESKKSEKEHVN